MIGNGCIVGCVQSGPEVRIAPYRRSVLCTAERERRKRFCTEGEHAPAIRSFQELIAAGGGGRLYTLSERLSFVDIVKWYALFGDAGGCKADGFIIDPGDTEGQI